MDKLKELSEKVLGGAELSKEEAMLLWDAPLEELRAEADKIRAKFCGNGFDLCTIINGKNGKCSEDCRYCAQSAHYKTTCAESYPLLDYDEIYKVAKSNDEAGVLRFSIVTSGRALPDKDVEKLAEIIRRLKKETKLEICISLGLIGEKQFKLLKDAGASRVHCNLETSRKFFPSICTTHTYDEKIATLEAARKAGLSVCSGGIFGLGETREDRVEMLIFLRELKVTSIPVNFLQAIEGTPLEGEEPLSSEERQRCVAVARFILPSANIRLAGGRGVMPDKGEGCFTGGANAAISGDMLTTVGITTKTDREMLARLGYEVKLSND